MISFCVGVFLLMEERGVEVKKIKLKIKLLVYGFPLMTGYFVLDGFELKAEKIDVDAISQMILKNPFIPSGYIYNCVLQSQDDEKNYCNFFENVECIEYNISNSEAKSKENVIRHFFVSNDVKELINNFKKKLRLIYNLRIIFPIYKVTVFDANDKFVGCFVSYNDFPSLPGLRDKFNKEEFSKNSRTGFDLKSFLLTEKNNIKFGRAMMLFNDSFDSSDVSIRFLLLFSCLESLFVTSKNGIVEKMALCTSRILCYENIKDEEKMYKRIKELYNYRCKFVHGKQVKSITCELEMELREIVRYVLLIYWNLSLSGKASNQIINILKNKEEIPLQIKLYAKVIMYDNYEQAYKEGLEMIATEIVKGNVVITKQENGIIKSVKEI